MRCALPAAVPGRWASPSTRRAGAHRGVSQVEAPHVVPAGIPVAPSASHVATSATATSVEQLDLFALLAPKIAHLGTALRKPRAEVHPTQQVTSAWPFLDAQPLAVGTAEAVAQTGALTASVFDAYRPQVRVVGSKPHPTRLVESAAMAAATAPPCFYRPTLPRHLVERGTISDAQLEAVCRAGDAHGLHLPGGGADQEGPRQGFFIGDATGVGKGRAQPLHARVLTPTGWRLMGEIQVGDLVVEKPGLGHIRVTGRDLGEFRGLGQDVQVLDDVAAGARPQLDMVSALHQTTSQLGGEPFLPSGVRFGDGVAGRTDHGYPHQVASAANPAR